MHSVLVSLAFLGMVFGPATLAFIGRSRAEDDF
jgi:hypothetical protein